MSTMREWLNKANFDWSSATIILHTTSGNNPGWAGKIESRVEIQEGHDVLDKEFDDGYGGPECPRFIAYDNLNTYFPCQYDGATWLTVVARDPSYYLKDETQTPYPGG